MSGGEGRQEGGPDREVLDSRSQSRYVRELAMHCIGWQSARFAVSGGACAERCL